MHLNTYIYNIVNFKLKHLKQETMNPSTETTLSFFQNIPFPQPLTKTPHGILDKGYEPTTPDLTDIWLLPW